MFFSLERHEKTTALWDGKRWCGRVKSNDTHAMRMFFSKKYVRTSNKGLGRRMKVSPTQPRVGGTFWISVDAVNRASINRCTRLRWTNFSIVSEHTMLAQKTIRNGTWGFRVGHAISLLYLNESTIYFATRIFLS